MAVISGNNLCLLETNLQSRPLSSPMKKEYFDDKLIGIYIYAISLLEFIHFLEFVLYGIH